MRDARLSRLHEAIHAALAERGVASQPYYAPDAWVPHITLAQQNLAPGLLPAVLVWCARRPLAWELAVTNLTVARATEHGLEVKAPLDLGSA
ncbi:MAG: 2'-5' RNA ligase family protein [Hyphomicrobiales bacterium]